MANALPQGSGFTNINKIIQANQTNQLGNTVQGGAQNNANQLQSGISKSQGQFTTDANNANLNTAGNQTNVNTIIGNATSTTPSQGPDQPTATTKAAQTAAAQPVTQGPQVNASGGNTNTALASAAQPSSTPNSTTATPSTTAASTPTPASTSSTTASAPATPSSDQTTENTSLGSFGFSSGTSSGANTTQANPYVSYGQQQQFQNYTQGAYNGPTGLSNANQIQAQGQNLNALGQAAVQPGGTQALLRQYITSPNYTQGEQTLDSAILGQTGAPQLRNAIQTLQGAGATANNAVNNATAQAQGIAAGNSAFGQQATQADLGAQDAIQEQIGSNLNTLNSQNQAYGAAGQQIYNDLNPAAGSSPLTAKQQQTNISDALNTAVQNGMIDMPTLQKIQTQVANGANPQTLLASMFNYTPGAALPQYTMQQGASDQQAGNLNALSSLLGQQGQYNTYGGLALPDYSFTPAGQTGAAARAQNYNIANNGNWLVPAALAATGITSAGNILSNAAKGNVVGTANATIGAPSSIVGGTTAIANTGINTGGNLVSGAVKGVPVVGGLASGVVQGGSQLAQVPLAALNSTLSPLSTGTQGAVSDLSHGNIGGAIGSELGGALSAISNPVASIVSGVSNAIGDVSRGVSSVFSGGRWFCTELYKRKLIGMPEMFQMSKFLLRSSITRTNMCLFYADYGDYIVLVANQHNFDWSTIKDDLTTNVIKLMNSGKFSEAQELYTSGIKKMIQMYPESAYLWNDRLNKTTFSDILRNFIPLMCTYTFHQAVKIYFNGLFKRKV